MNGNNGKIVRSVLIAEGSELFSGFLRSVADNTQGFSVCGCACDAFSAKSMIEKYKPDIIVLDCDIPKMGAVSFMRKLLPQYTVPVIVCASGRDKLIQIMEAGAADYLLRPGDGGGTFEEFRERFIRALRASANLKRIKSGCTYYNIKQPSETRTAAVQCERLIAIGGSAGSTEALPEILKEFDADTPPIAIVLHLPEGYTKLFAKRINEETRLKAVEAAQGLYLEKGMAVIAPGDMHMRIYKDKKGYFASCERGAKVSGHCPSVDVTFESCAACAGKDAIGVILTGMGNDGARGLAAMKAAGAYTIGQSERSCAVYGMPKAALNAGALTKQCDLDRIAAEIYNRLKE